MSKLPEKFTTLSEASKIEFEEKRSIFIGQAKRVDSEEEALDFIKSVKKEYMADNVCHIFYRRLN